MDTHEEVWQVLGAWALNACDEDEARLVAAHLPECPPCRGEAGRLRRAADVLDVLGDLKPPAGMRDRLLSAALSQRPPAVPDLRRLVADYRVQIDALGGLLESLDRESWAAPVPRHGSVHNLIEHLSANDHILLAAIEGGAARADTRAPQADASTPNPDADTPQPDTRAPQADTSTPNPDADTPQPEASTSQTNANPMDPIDPQGWQRRANRLADRLATTRLVMKLAPVRLAGPVGLRRPIRDAVVQRLFETWVHADDVRLAVGLPRQAPDERAIGHIIDLGVGLLPVVLTVLGRSHPGMTGTLELSGPGAGIWTVPLSTTDNDDGHDHEPVCAISADAVDFCRLMAGRLAPDALQAGAGGEPGPLRDLLEVAARLGCDPDKDPDGPL